MLMTLNTFCLTQFFCSALLLVGLFVGFLIFFTSSMIMSLMFLITLFVMSSLSFIVWTNVYLAAVFVIVYIGAIAILFLFVIMLVNKFSVSEFNTIGRFVFMGLFLAFVDGFLAYFGGFFTDMLFWSLDRYDALASDLRMRVFFYGDPVAHLGFFLYNYYFFYVVFLGLLLFIILVGLVLLLQPSLQRQLVVTRLLTARSGTLLLTKATADSSKSV